MVDPVLNIRPTSECRWDCAALGEVMLRFDPGMGRVRTARSFDVWEGGGEYNVARALRKCFGLRSTVLTALPRNEVGYLAEDLMMQGGVDLSHLIWRDYDGMGRNTRVGLNFTEKGFGVRAPLGVSDRANSAASQIRPGEINWNKLFGEDGVRWLHTGGIFAALAPNTAEVVIEAVEAAKAHGVVVSYDLNYRPSLWEAHGGREAAKKINAHIARYVDVMIGGNDLAECLGFDVPEGADLRTLIEAAVRAFPNFKVVASTLREAKSATLNDWSAILYAGGNFYSAIKRENLEIYDRVGGGDGFASGLAYAFMQGLGPQAAVDYGAAHAALVMTTPGDTSMARLSEVEALIKDQGAHMIR